MTIENSKSKSTPRMMKLIDKQTGEMQCRACGAKHFASIREGGRYYRGSWQCQNGCKPADLTNTR